MKSDWPNQTICFKNNCGWVEKYIRETIKRKLVSQRLKRKDFKKPKFRKLTWKRSFYNSESNSMFVGESRNWKTINIWAQLDLYCIGLGNPKNQLLAVQRYYNATGNLKACLKAPWFANTCREVCARPVNEHFIYQSWGAKSCLLKKFNGNLNTDEQNGCWKTPRYF